MEDEYVNDEGKESIMQMYVSLTEFTGNAFDVLTLATSNDVYGEVFRPYYLPSRTLVDLYEQTDLRLAAWYDNTEYKSVPFVSLDMSSVEVEESDPATLLTIPVRLYNNKSGCTVTYTVTDVSAKVGTNCTIGDDSVVLTFADGVDSLAVQLNITGQPGTFTGSRTLVVELGTANNGVTLGNFSVCQVSIKDLDHPLSDLFGAYSMEAVAYYSSSSAAGYYIWDWTMNMTAYEGDATRVWLDNIGSDISYGGESYSLPALVRADASYNVSAARLRAEADYLLAGAFGAMFAAGDEIAGLVTPQAGYHLGSDDKGLPSYAFAGVGVRFSGLAFRLSYLLDPDTLGGSVLAGLSWEW